MIHVRMQAGFIQSILGKGSTKNINYLHGIFHGGVPPPPSSRGKLINFFQQFFKFLFCGKIALKQTWKKARTRGHCPRKFWQIVEILCLWGLILLKYAVKR